MWEMNYLLVCSFLRTQLLLFWKYTLKQFCHSKGPKGNEIGKKVKRQFIGKLLNFIPQYPLQVLTLLGRLLGLFSLSFCFHKPHDPSPRHFCLSSWNGFFPPFDRPCLVKVETVLFKSLMYFLCTIHRV